MRWRTPAWKAAGWAWQCATASFPGERTRPNARWPPCARRSVALPAAPRGWLALVGIAVFGTVVAVSAFFAALALLGPGDTAVVSTVEPVVSVVAAFLVLGERLSLVQVLGGLLVLSAVLVLTRSRPVEEVVPA